MNLFTEELFEVAPHSFIRLDGVWFMARYSQPDMARRFSGQVGNPQQDSENRRS